MLSMLNSKKTFFLKHIILFCVWLFNNIRTVFLNHIRLFCFWLLNSKRTVLLNHNKLFCFWLFNSKSIVFCNHIKLFCFWLLNIVRTIFLNHIRLFCFWLFNGERIVFLNHIKLFCFWSFIFQVIIPLALVLSKVQSSMNFFGNYTIIFYDNIAFSYASYIILNMFHVIKTSWVILNLVQLLLMSTLEKQFKVVFFAYILRKNIVFTSVYVYVINKSGGPRFICVILVCFMFSYYVYDYGLADNYIINHVIAFLGCVLRTILYQPYSNVVMNNAFFCYYCNGYYTIVRYNYNTGIASNHCDISYGDAYLMCVFMLGHCCCYLYMLVLWSFFSYKAFSLSHAQTAYVFMLFISLNCNFHLSWHLKLFLIILFSKLLLFLFAINSNMKLRHNIYSKKVLYIGLSPVHSVLTSIKYLTLLRNNYENYPFFLVFDNG